MDIGIALVAIAEVMLGLAGFSGIVMALTFDQGRWHPWDAWRTLMLLSTTLGAIVLALLPFGFSLLGLAESAIWRLSSGIMAAYPLILAPAVYRSFQHLEPASHPYYRPIAVFSLTGIGLNIVAQLLNTLSFIFPGVASVFFFGLLWYLIYSAFLFAITLFVRPRKQ